MGVTGTEDDAVAVVECHDAAHAQHWSVVQSDVVEVASPGESYSYSYA